MRKSIIIDTGILVAFLMPSDNTISGLSLHLQMLTIPS